MSNDENKTVQQSLPLSWDESDVNFEQKPKKLLLKHQETPDEEPEEQAPTEEDSATQENDLFQHEEELFEEENSDIIENTILEQQEQHTPKPLLLKKAPDLSEDKNYRYEQNSQETVFHEDDDEDDEGDQDDDLENSYLGQEQKTTLELDEEEEPQLLHSHEDNHSPLEELETASILDKDFPTAFEDSGTFSLDENIDDEENDNLEESDNLEIERDDDSQSINEQSNSNNRLSITEGALEDLPESSLENELDESTVEEDSSLDPKESIFALKADTFYDHRDIEPDQESKNDIDENAEPSEVVKHQDVQSIGSMLQEARLAQSFTIKSASETTRIKSSYIIALENNDMDALPAKVYTLNYIRQLCREYNISHEPLVEQFEKQREDINNEVKVVRVGDDDARKATKPNSKLNSIVVASSLAFFAILLLTAFSFKWFAFGDNKATLENIEINLEDVRNNKLTLPTWELPVPTR